MDARLRGESSESVDGTSIPGVGTRELRLRPLWVGFALTTAGFLLFALLANFAGARESASLAAAFSLPASIYYFMMVHRVVRVLDMQPGWSSKYTPAAAVWNHFVPIYGVYFLYRWPADVESFVSSRLARRSHFAILTFVVLLAGTLLRFFDYFAGLYLMMASLCFVYVPLRCALSAGIPAEPSLTG